MGKEIFKVGYQKQKSSPLQGVEPESSCMVVWQLRKKQPKVHLLRETNPDLCGPKKLMFSYELQLYATAASDRKVAKTFAVVLVTACFYLKFA